MTLYTCYSFAISFLLVLSCSFNIANGQTLTEKWGIDEDTVITSFDPNTNTFTQTFDVDDSILLANTGGEIYDEECKEGGSAVYLDDEGILNIGTAIAGTGLATLSFDLDLDILRQDPTVFLRNPLDAQDIRMKICSRFFLQTGDASLEVNYLETIITLFFDLEAGFDVTGFTVDVRERIETIKDKEYGAEGYLCDPANPTEELESNIFPQGSIISVCVQPDEASKADGILLFSIDSFKWVRGAIEQDAVEGGSSASNGLTSPLGCAPYSEICSFSTMLFADFYSATPEPTQAPAEGGGGGGSFSYYSCSLELPVVNTTELVHGACLSDGWLLLTQENQTGHIHRPYERQYDFNRNTLLFGDKNYTADIAYDGYRGVFTNYSDSICDGGSYDQPVYFEDAGVANRTINILAEESDAYDHESMTMRPCIFVIDDDSIANPMDRRDGNSYHDWFVDQGYNDTVSEFDIIDTDPSTNVTTVVGTMKSYCFDFQESDCAYHHSGGLRKLQSSKMSSEVGGVGTATLTFPPQSRRKLGRNNNKRGLQQDDTFTSDLGITINVLSREDGPERMRTAGTCGIQKTSSVWAVVICTGFLLCNVLCMT